MIRSTLLSFIAAITIGGCAVMAPRDSDLASIPSNVQPFSSQAAGALLDGAWRPWSLSRLKRDTQYRLIKESGETVLMATAEASASGLIHPLRVDLKVTPYLQWRWKVPMTINGADNTQRDAEDSPVRMVIAFDGDKEKLDFDDRIFFARMKAITGQEPPYATLMYIWENKLPERSIVSNHHTSRVKMIVAESGAQSEGQWRTETHNVYEDYRRAFGEDPPAVIYIGVMTDTDNTAQRTTAFYGDIRFMPTMVLAEPVN